MWQLELLIHVLITKKWNLVYSMSKIIKGQIIYCDYARTVQVMSFIDCISNDSFENVLQWRHSSAVSLPVHCWCYAHTLAWLEDTLLTVAFFVASQIIVFVPWTYVCLMLVPSLTDALIDLCSWVSTLLCNYDMRNLTCLLTRKLWQWLVKQYK